MDNITVLLADDHTLMREGLTALLAKERDIQVVGEAENGRDALEKIRDLNPKVLIVDISMPILNGVDTTKLALKRWPSLRVLALSMHSDGRYARQMFEAGALGYVLKTSIYQEIVSAIRSVGKGRRYYGLGVNFEPENKNGYAIENKLSTREREVLQLIAEGRKTAEIGERLGISSKTVEAHRRRIMEKLNTNSIASLVKYAIREGLATLDD